MNIVLIVVDTLRASRLGCYGYEKPTSPAMDRLAAEGIQFARCIAPGIPTTPAHTTIYTGQHPLTHNIVTHGGQVDLDRKTPVLPELLQQAGYTTAAVDNLVTIKPWFARGYEFYIDPSYRHRYRLLVSCEEINARAIPWLRAYAHEKFFLFLHYWDPHTPYTPPEKYCTFYPPDRDPFSPEHTSLAPIRRQPIWGMFNDIWFSRLGPVTDAEYIASLYDAQIRHVDDGIAELLAALDAMGLSENTLVVLTGDHGESLYQHDIYFDHHGLYDDVIHVPLILRCPTVIPAGQRFWPMVQHLDLAPTILEAAGVPVPAGMEGKSLWPVATGKTNTGGWERVICCESTWQSKWAVRTDTAKFILAREPDRHNMPMRELYDLTTDPGETHNLAIERWEEAEDLEAALERWIAEGLARVGRTEDPLRVQGITLGKRWDHWRAARS
ncbi:MAG: sulfatase [Chloroherpetonaceae bacterium]|nr:sulfatase-like hydrolase/transferase [Chthonomonadaceae bacterium]MDW8207412.1 sulfatase [Chloroherpetonaceae bacterium]